MMKFGYRRLISDFPGWDGEKICLAEHISSVLYFMIRLLIGLHWPGGRQLYVLNLSDPDFKFPSIPFECALPDNCRITMLKVSVDNLALFVGVETDRPEKYKGDVYKINAKDGTILEHYQRFGGTPVDMVEKKSVEYDVEE